MAEKDITEKILLSYADVFADCINTLVYGGKRYLNPGNTQPAPTETFYKAKKPRNQFCDTSRYLTEEGTVLLQYIIENETELEERQILRKISYEGGSYRQQLGSGTPVYGVTIIVIVWTGKSSRIPQSLHTLLLNNGVPQKHLEMIDDAKLTVYHMNNLSPETRSLFTSDLGFVADYLNEGNFDSRREQEILHLDALCDLMEALTGDTRFTELANEFWTKHQNGDAVMACEYLDLLEARGEKLGEKRGEINGETNLSSLLEKLFDLGRSQDVELAVRNPDARARMFKEFSIPSYRDHK